MGLMNKLDLQICSQNGTHSYIGGLQYWICTCHHPAFSSTRFSCHLGRSSLFSVRENIIEFIVGKRGFSESENRVIES